ncbi:MAG: hypothetical protein L0228_17305 [Planctomycetes bacterium]|nr:hypothetical protein [Planctomycetota bacterium]
MASPFRVFRKNVKPLLAIFVVMLMLAWVGGSGLTTYMSGPRGRGGDPSGDENAVAVSWEGGSLTNQELANLVARRRYTNEFLKQVEILGGQSAYLAGIEPPALRVQRLMGPETPEQRVERSVVRTKLFADAAREAGMHINDDAVVQYLDELGRGRVTRDEMRGILQRMQSEGWMIDALRDEMLARNYFMSNMYALQTVTPDQRWKDWLSVNDRIVVEAAAIPVETFMADVKEPTEAELTEFFDEYKSREASPEIVGNTEIASAVPGFRVPRKIDVQYIQANIGDMVNKAEEAITDAEIEQYYNENKEQFIKADTSLFDDTTDAQDPAKTDEAATESTTSEETGDAEPATTTEGTDETNATTEPPSANETPAPTNELQPAAPAETQPPAEGAREETAPADEDQSSRGSAAKRNLFRHVAFLQETRTDGAEEGAAEEEPASTTEPAASADPAAAPATTDDAAKPADSPADTSAATPAINPPATNPPVAEKSKEYQPLDEVRDQIRRELAQRQVAEKLKTQMEELLAELKTEFDTYFVGQVLEAQSKDEKVPAPPAVLVNLSPLAEKHGLSTAKTGPMSVLELRDTPVGKSGSPDSNESLLRTLFLTDDLELYQPTLTVDIDGNHYIAIKTTDTPGRTPELAEVRDEVVRAWKRQKATELALKDAEAEAKNTQESGSPLADYFADRPTVEVIRVDPFSQLTRGDVPDQFGHTRFRISQPDGLVAPGPELLRRVFELKDGEAGAALNHDHSIAYVVRVVKHQNSRDQLRTAYLAEANTWDGLQTLTGERAVMAQQSVTADVSGGTGIDWKREPDQLRQEGETGE